MGKSFAKQDEFQQDDWNQKPQQQQQGQTIQERLIKGAAMGGNYGFQQRQAQMPQGNPVSPQVMSTAPAEPNFNSPEKSVYELYQALFGGR